jgi:hypothetical protein
MTDRVPWLRLVLVIVTGIQTGRFVDQWLILLFSFRSLDAPAFSAAVRSLGAATRVSMLASAMVMAFLFAAILLKERDVRSPRGRMTVVAVGLFLLEVTFTIVHEVPLVARIESLRGSPPGWQALRTEWLAGHTACTVLGLGLFVAVVLAFRREGRPPPRLTGTAAGT